MYSQGLDTFDARVKEEGKEDVPFHSHEDSLETEGSLSTELIT